MANALASPPLPVDLLRPSPLWRNISFMLMWSSVAASGFGDRMIELAALPMLGVTDTDTQAGPIIAAVYFWFFLPWLFITPIGGWLADTLPRKWIMLACDQGRAVLLLVAVIMVGNFAGGVLPEGHAWKVFAILAGVGFFAAIFSPTRNAMIPQIVPLSQLNPANATILGIGVIASMIGYGIGGWLLGFSVRTGLIVALLCYGISGWFFAFLRPRPHTGLEIDRDLSEWTRMTRALRHIRKHRHVLRLVILNALLWSVAMVVAPAVGALCKHRYGLEPGQYLKAFGTMNAAIGGGMLAGSLWVAWMNVRREADVVVLFCVAWTAVWLVVLALNRSFAVGLGLSFLIGFNGGAVLIMVASMTQALVPNFILGRVGGVREVLSNVVSVLVNLLIWMLPTLQVLYSGTPDADQVLIAALYPMAALLVAVVVLGVFKRLRRGPMANPQVNVLWRLIRLYVLVWHRYRWVNRDAVPSEGAVILAANHTTGLDPFLIQSAVPRLVRWVMLTQYKFRILNPMWKRIEPIALDRKTSDLARLRQVMGTLKRGEVVGLFPEGGLQRDRRELQPFEPGVAMIAVRSGAWLVPVWISGTPAKRHMLWHFLLPSRSVVIFGKAYRPEGDDYEKITEDLRRRMMALGAEV